jgi:uncharacterized protein (TIGR03086 family)
MATEGLVQAMANTRAVLAKVTADQYDQTTPCASWDVRALINHIVGGSYYFAACVNEGKHPGTANDTDFTQGDLMAAYDEGIAAAVAAFDAPGALDKMIVLPFGTFPCTAFLGLATNDQFTHGWDLARATGQATDMAPELAAQLLEGAKASIPDQFRGPDGQAPFAPAQEAGADASAADALAAFMGRKV